MKLFVEIKFGSDTAERKRWFTGASFSHPAKMHIQLQLYLIEHYTKPGETILDPMGGSGSLLVACALGRNVICVELEQKFCDMMEANWRKIKSLGPMLGYTMGRAQIIQGDARQLDEILVDKCVFSPPYAERLAGMDKSWGEKHKGGGTRFTQLDYGDKKDNIGNLPYGQIDKIVTSPPYEGSLSGLNENGQKARTKRLLKAGYDPKDYQDGIGRQCEAAQQYSDPLDPSIKHLRKHGRTDPGAGGPYGKSLAHPYSGAAENIGNLKSDNYLSAMLQVYQGCFAVLRPRGLCCLVVKNFIRDKKIVRLDLDTIKLCEKAGFKLIERLKRKLTQQSFWRIIYQQKFPNAPKIEFEDVLIFEKE